MRPQKISKFLWIFICSFSVAQKVVCKPSKDYDDFAFANEQTQKSKRALLRAKAAEMQSYMNESVDPCTNFYEFACGNWPKLYPVKWQQERSTSTVKNLMAAHKRKALELLTANEAHATATAADEKVKNFFQSCMQMRKVSTGSQQQLKATIKEFGQMPALQPWQQPEQAQQFDWLDVIARIAYKYDIEIMLGTNVVQDIANHSMNRIYFGQADLQLRTRAMYVDDVTAPYRADYRQRITTNLQQFLAVAANEAALLATDIVNFETELGAQLFDVREGGGLSEAVKLMTLNEMQQKYAPIIDVKKYLQIIYGKMSNKQKIYDYHAAYQLNLMRVLHQTPKQTVANYIYYKLVEGLLFQPSKTHAQQLSVCYDKTRTYFAKLLDNMIYRKYGKTQKPHDINLLWQQLKQAFAATLRSNDMNWIARSTVQLAIEKLQAMKLHINAYEEQNFTQQFDDLFLSETDFLSNMQSMQSLKATEKRASLNGAPKSIADAQALINSPANIIIENVVTLPVLLLQTYSYWSDFYTNALKFGTLGNLLAHEIIHGFDDNGRKFDKNGISSNWWDADSTQQFMQRIKCFTEQYHKYFYAERLLPKSISQAENIADNAGLRLAHTAYMNWYVDAARAGKNLNDELMPNLSYTSEQLFFISYAQMWCVNVLPEWRDYQTFADEHTPNEFRVIGTVSNFDEFAEAFNCPINAPMNPAEKCVLY